MKNPMRNVVWYSWAERIDDEAIAGCAMSREVHRGSIFQASTFVLVQVDRTRSWSTGRIAKEKALEKLADELRRRVHISVEQGAGYFMSRFGMPYVGQVRDLQR